jgi:nucleotide-binding universal stress UspA family protein
MLAIRTILHPTDFSPRSEYAFRLACSLAHDHGGKVVIVHVATPAPVVTADGVINQWNYADYADQLWPALNRMKAPEGDVTIERRLEIGDPATVIMDLAKELHADMIVLGTHGKRGLERLLLGSVAEQVLRRATCPVLTVKGTVPAPEKQAARVPAMSAT